MNEEISSNEQFLTTNKPDKSMIKQLVIPTLGMLIIFTVLWFLKSHIYIVFEIDDYLVWHNILEFSSIVVSIIIFLISWYNYKQLGNQQELFLGIAFLIVGAVDFMHTLSFPGMPAFVSQNSTGKAINYWLVARLIQATALAGSGFISTRQRFHRFLRTQLLLAALFFIALTFYVITYLPHIIPEMFIAEKGLTPTKIWLEYSVIFIILIAICKYVFIFKQRKTRMVWLLLLGMIFFIFSELSFTLYASAFDIFNLLGHIFKTGTMISIFLALFVSGVQEPYIKRKIAEEKARIERDNLNNIFKAMKDGIYIVNQQYDIQYVNSVLTKDFGSYEGKKCYEYFHARKKVCPWCKSPEVFAGKTVHWEWFSSKNGKTYDLVDTPLKNPDGSISKLEIFRDITERKMAEDELAKHREHLKEIVEERTKELKEKTKKLEKSQQSLTLLLKDVNESRDELNESNKGLEEKTKTLEKSQKSLALLLEDVNESRAELDISNRKLEASNKELEAFSYSVSHDLRAPLRHIDGFTKLLNKKIKNRIDEKSQNYFDNIISSSKQMNKLIDDLLIFSRMGRKDVKKTNINMKTVVDEAIQEFDSDIKENNISIKIDKMPEVNLDASLMRQTWVNLISNAIKFTGNKENPEIHIGTEKDADGKIIFFIKDNGVGFDQKYVDKIFGVFQRLHNINEFPGTGIGLANVKRIILKHGGDIRAEGKINEGASFFFTLPNPDKPEKI